MNCHSDHYGSEHGVGTCKQRQGVTVWTLPQPFPYKSLLLDTCQHIHTEGDGLSPFGLHCFLSCPPLIHTAPNTMVGFPLLNLHSLSLGEHLYYIWKNVALPYDTITSQLHANIFTTYIPFNAERVKSTIPFTVVSSIYRRHLPEFRH